MVNQQVCHNDGFLQNCCLISLVGGINQVEYQFLQCHRQATMLSLTAVSYYCAPVQDQPAKPEGPWAGPWGCWCAQRHTQLVRGWWDGAEGGLCRGSVPGDTPQSIAPAAAHGETTHGWVMFLTRDAWCLCLLFNGEEIFQSVARLNCEARIFVSWQAELPSTKRQLHIATKGEAIHRPQINILKINLNGLVFL